MKVEIHRRTERTVDLCDVPEVRDVRIRKEYGQADFRPTRLVESLVERDPAPRFSSIGYSVRLSGPVQTSKGADHAAHRGERTFAEGGYRTSLAEIPEPIRALLIGPDALAGPMPQDGADR